METLNNKVTGGTLTATEWNQVPSELQNVITQTGQTLTNIDLNQLGKGIAQYAGNGAFYIDSGAANAYVLTQIGTKQASTSLDNGMIIRFLVGNTNTTASTVNPATLGVTTFVNFNGEAFLGGELVAGEIVRAFFDAGNTRFQLLPEITTSNFSLLKSGRKNLIINGNFDLWQRGVSFTNPDSVYTADRWISDTLNVSGTGNITQELFTLGQTDVPNEPEFFLRHDQTLAAGGSDLRVLSQKIEGVRTSANQILALSLFAKAGASKTLQVFMRQSFGTGGSPSADVSTAQQAIALTTSFQKFTLIFSIPSISSKTLGTNGDDHLELRIFEETPFTTFTADFAQIQLEEGTIATDFEMRPIAEELELAQRYFERGQIFLRDDIDSAGNYTFGTLQQYAVAKRVPSTIVLSNDTSVGTVSTATSTSFVSGFEYNGSSVASGLATATIGFTFAADSEL